MKMMKKVQLTLVRTQLRVQNFLADERGDTNFISILIILGIVLAIALVFMGFKDQIVGVASEKVSAFLESF